MSNRFSYSSGAPEALQAGLQMYKLGKEFKADQKEAEMDAAAKAIAERQQGFESRTSTDYAPVMEPGGGDTPMRTPSGLERTTPVTTQTQPEQYTYGGQTRSTAFTPEERKGINTEDTYKALAGYGKEGQARAAEMQQAEARGLQIESAKRAEKASMKELEDTTALGAMRSKMADATPEERVKLSAEYEAEAFKRLGQKAIPLLTSDMQFATAKVNQQKEVAAAELLKAAETPQSMVDWANKKGMSVVLHESKDGRTYFVNDLNKDGKVSADEAGSVSSLGSFKTGDWVGEGRKLLVQHQPEIVDFAAKKDIEFEYAKKLQSLKNEGIKARSAAYAKDGTTVVGQVQLENGEWAVAYKTKGGTSFTEDEDGNRTPIGEKEVVKTGAKAKDSDDIVAAREQQTMYRAVIERDKDMADWRAGDRKKAEANLKASLKMYGDLSVAPKTNRDQGLIRQASPAAPPAAPAAAIAKLKANPGLAGAFKAKYGYLP